MYVVSNHLILTNLLRKFASTSKDISKNLHSTMNVIRTLYDNDEIWSTHEYTQIN